MNYNNYGEKKKRLINILLSAVLLVCVLIGSFSILGFDNKEKIYIVGNKINKIIMEEIFSTAEANAWHQFDEETTDVQWNTKDLDIATNGNILTAGKILAGMDDEKFQSKITQVFVGSVNKSPWKYYGQVIAFPGEVVVIQEYPPQSDISNWIANGGECAEIVLVTNEGVIVDALVIGSTGNINVGNYITVNGFPVGKVDAPNQLGGTTNELVVVGKI